MTDIKVKTTNNFTVTPLGKKECYVYDIEVEGNHNFFANGILVHNSNYITLSKLIKKLGIQDKSKQEIVNFIDSACENIGYYIESEYNRLAKMNNCFSQQMFMDREVIADKGFWTAKKRYALNVLDSEGVRYDNPKLKIMGLETVKSSTPAICRKKLKEAIRLILTENENAVIDFIDNFREEFYSLSAAEVSFPRGVQEIEKYEDPVYLYVKGTPIHVKGSLIYNKFITDNKLQKKYQLIRGGDKIKFCYLKLPNPLHQSVLAFIGSPPKEMEIEEYVDYEKQFDKTFMEPIKQILSKVGWNFEHTNTLDSMFV